MFLVLLAQEKSKVLNGAITSAELSDNLPHTDCGIVLPAESSHRWERVRVWRREGRFMLHNVSRMGTVTVGGRPAIWVVLEDGDEIQLGNCRLLFRET